MTTHLDCEFCSELFQSNHSTFTRIYGHRLESRAVVQTSNFIVFPTIGQLFQNSLLVVPRIHIGTLAKLDPQHTSELTKLFIDIKASFFPETVVIAFEHGAEETTRGGCGIYHAHLHIVPVPEEVDLSAFLKGDVKKFNNIETAFSSVHSSTEYLLAINNDNSIGLEDVTISNIKYGSQFFRRKLQEHFKLSASWNWRDYNYPEEMLINSVSILRVLGHGVSFASA